MSTLAVALLSGAFAKGTDCVRDSDCAWMGMSFACHDGVCEAALGGDDQRRILPLIPAIALGATAGLAGAALADVARDNDDSYDGPRYYQPRVGGPRPYYPAPRPNPSYYPTPSYYPSLLPDVGSENGGCQSNDDCQSGASCYLGSNGRNFCDFGGSHGTLCDDNSDCAWNQNCQYGVCMVSGRRLDEDEESSESSEGLVDQRRILPLLPLIPSLLTATAAVGTGLGVAALADEARNNNRDNDRYYQPRYNQPRYYPQQPSYNQPRPSNFGVGSNNGGCQSAHDCPGYGSYCYLGDNGSPNFCGNIGSGAGSLCEDNSSCPGNTFCQYGVCRVLGGGRRLQGESEELLAPASSMTVADSE